MFGTIEPTPYDLRFTLGGIPVRVSIWFWAAAAILGYSNVHLGFDFLLMWVLVVFLSILVHEMGHALTARFYGYPPRILLYQFGGLAMYEPWGNYTRWKAIAISLAGPGAGFALYGILILLTRLGDVERFLGSQERTGRLILMGLIQLKYVNLWWGLINLLPVLPLDGGRICEQLCSWWSLRRGQDVTLMIGAVVAGVVAAYFFAQRDMYPAILFALLCAENASSLQRPRW